MVPVNTLAPQLALHGSTDFLQTFMVMYSVFDKIFQVTKLTGVQPCRTKQESLWTCTSHVNGMSDLLWKLNDLSKYHSQDLSMPTKRVA